MLRHDKITEAIKQEVSIILHDDLKDPRLGFITITGVELSQDYRNAKVFYSVLGKEEDYKKTQEALESGMGFIRRLITRRINLKFSPEIIFRQDRSNEYSVRIQQVLDEIKGLEKPAELPAVIKRTGAKRKNEPKKRRPGTKKTK
jgi:ribosome-binding factor A